jgi:hypothetical protein
LELRERRDCPKSALRAAAILGRFDWPHRVRVVGDRRFLPLSASPFSPLGLIGSLGDARAIVRESFEVKTYTPRPSSAWESAYQRFLKLIPSA